MNRPRIIGVLRTMQVLIFPPRPQGRPARITYLTTTGPVRARRSNG